MRRHRGGREGDWSGRRASEPAGEAARRSARPRGSCRPPGASFPQGPHPGPDPPARLWPQHPGVAHAPGPAAPARPQPLPRAAATPPAHVTLAPLFPRRRLAGTPPFSRSGPAPLSVPSRVSCSGKDGGQPRLRSRRGAGAGLLPGTESLVGSGPSRGMAREPVLWCAALPEMLIAIASRPQKTFGGGLSLAFFLGSPKPRWAICHLGPVTTALWAIGFAWPWLFKAVDEGLCRSCSQLCSTTAL